MMMPKSAPVFLNRIILKSLEEDILDILTGFLGGTGLTLLWLWLSTVADEELESSVSWSREPRGEAREDELGLVPEAEA